MNAYLISSNDCSTKGREKSLGLLDKVGPFIFLVKQSSDFQSQFCSIPDCQYNLLSLERSNLKKTFFSRTC